MATSDDRNASWPNWQDVLIFCGAIFVFMYVGAVTFVGLAKLLGLPVFLESESVFQYGGISVLILLFFVGSISFVFGGFVVRRMRRMRARWLSGVVGAIYSFVFTGLAMLIRIPHGESAGTTLMAFFFLFPAIGLILGSWKLTRPIPPLQSDRPQAGGS